jgi:hypothetical protein
LSDQPFTKENLEQVLKELAKEFRKRNGKSVSAEMILIGPFPGYSGRLVSRMSLAAACETAINI